jgi:hypothetical protein
VATFVPDGDVPAELNDVAFAPWADVPQTAHGWASVAGQRSDLIEPPFPSIPGKPLAAGIVIEWPDDRVWMVAPTNRFGGYTAAMPKGRLDDLRPQATAIREAFEESGLQVEIVDWLIDVQRSTTLTRIYRARRVGGTPAAMGLGVAGCAAGAQVPARRVSDGRRSRQAIGEDRCARPLILPDRAAPVV